LYRLKRVAFRTDAGGEFSLELAMRRLGELCHAGVSFGFPEELSIDRNAANRL
jgi:hypothetical protein